MPILESELDAWFSYGGVNVRQSPKYHAIGEAAYKLAQTIRENTPESPDQTAAILTLRAAVLTAYTALDGGRK